MLITHLPKWLISWCWAFQKISGIYFLKYFDQMYTLLVTTSFWIEFLFSKFGHVWFIWCRQIKTCFHPLYSNHTFSSFTEKDYRPCPQVVQSVNSGTWAILKVRRSLQANFSIASKLQYHVRTRILRIHSDIIQQRPNFIKCLGPIVITACPVSQSYGFLLFPAWVRDMLYVG
jgi:hypothetical protein